MARNVQRHTGFRIPPDIDEKMNALIENKEFTTKADIVRTALRYWFDNRGKDPETVVKDLFEKGKFDVAFKEAVEGVVIEVLEEQKKKKKK
jgi:Arc/MetJ-type ribon-helix-helix transcriptional regulator